MWPLPLTYIDLTSGLSTFRPVHTHQPEEFLKVSVSFCFAQSRFSLSTQSGLKFNSHCLCLPKAEVPDVLGGPVNKWFMDRFSLECLSVVSHLTSTTPTPGHDLERPSWLLWLISKHAWYIPLFLPPPRTGCLPLPRASCVSQGFSLSLKYPLSGTL